MQIGSNFGYAYQFDSGLYAKFLRTYSEARGITRIEGKAVDVAQNDARLLMSPKMMQQGLWNR